MSTVITIQQVEAQQKPQTIKLEHLDIDQIQIINKEQEPVQGLKSNNNNQNFVENNLNIFGAQSPQIDLENNISVVFENQEKQSIEIQPNASQFKKVRIQEQKQLLDNARKISLSKYIEHKYVTEQDLKKDQQSKKAFEYKELNKTKIQGPKILRSKGFFIGLLLHALFTNYHFQITTASYSTLMSLIPKIYGWKTTSEINTYISLLSSLIYIGAVVGNGLLSKFQLSIGRRQMLMICDVFCIIGTALTVVANTYVTLAGRFIQGIVFGGYQSASVKYIVEITPKEYRKYLGVYTNFMVYVAIFIANVLGFGLPSNVNNTSNQYWRFQLLFPSYLSIIHLALFLFVYKNDTPLFVFHKTNDVLKTTKVLESIYTKERAQKEMEKMQKKINKEQSQQQQQLIPANPIENKNKQVSNEPQFKDMFTKNYRKRFFIGMLATLATILAGIQIYIIYAIKMQESVGIPTSRAKFINSLTVVADFSGVFAGFILIGKLGRKKLFLLSLGGCIINNIIISICIYTKFQVIVSICVLNFRFLWGGGIGTVYFIYVAEILPLIGVAICSIFYNLLGFTLVISFPFIIDSPLKPQGFYIISSVICVIVFVYLVFQMQETQGLNKQKIEKTFKSFINIDKTLRNSEYYIQKSHKNIGSFRYI